MFPEGLKKYTLISIQGTPAVVRSIFSSYKPNDPIFDKRPDPDRFTLREAIAHLADWDPIFMERIQRTLSEENPVLPSKDEGQMVIDNDYDHQETWDSVARLEASRPKLVEFLKGLSPDDFERIAIRPELGPMTIANQTLLIMAHDGYHTKQFAEYIANA